MPCLLPSYFAKFLMKRSARSLSLIHILTDAEFEALLGHPIPEDVVRIDRNMTLGEMDHGRSPLGWAAQKEMCIRDRFIDRVLYGRRDYLRVLFGDSIKEETE